MDELRVIRQKRGLSMIEEGSDEEIVKARKRQKVDSETQTTPKKENRLYASTEDSPMTKSLIKKAEEAQEILRVVTEAVELRWRSRELFDSLRVPST